MHGRCPKLDGMIAGITVLKPLVLICDVRSKFPFDTYFLYSDFKSFSPGRCSYST